MTAIPSNDDLARVAAMSAAIVRQHPSLQCECGTVSTMVIITHGDSTRVGFTPSDRCAADNEGAARRELADILVEVAASFSASMQEDDASGIDQ